MTRKFVCLKMLLAIVWLGIQVDANKLSASTLPVRFSFIQDELGRDDSATNDSEANDSATQKTQAEDQVNFWGIDYLHFWAIPPAQRKLIGRRQLKGTFQSVYQPDYHQKIFDDTQEIAEAQKSARLQSLLKTNAELYETKMEPTGSPFFYAVFGATRTGEFQVDYWIFQFSSGLLFALSIVLLGRNRDLKIGICVAMLLGFFFLFRPLQMDFVAANTNRIQLFLFTVFAVLISGTKKHWMWGGMILGLAVAFKLNSLFVPVFLLTGLCIERRFRDSIFVFAGLTFGLVAAVIIGGSDFGNTAAWIWWQDYLAETMKQPYPASSGNYSLASLLQTNSRIVSGAFVVAIWVSSVTAALYGRRDQPVKTGLGNHSDENEKCTEWAALGFLVFLASSPLVWSHYYVLAIPSIVFLSAGLFGEVSANFKRPLFMGLLLIGIVFCAAIPTTLFQITNPVAVTIILQIGVYCLIIATLISIAAKSIRPSTPANIQGF